MATLFQRHCSDESLISHLDGELPFYRRAGIRRHVEKCWQCRLRLSEMERQVLDTTRVMGEDAFPGPQRIADARLRFLSRADAIAEEVFRTGTRPARGFTLRGLAYAAACLALIGAFAVWNQARRPPAITTGEAMKRVEVAEIQTARIATHQRFRVVARQLRPAPVSRESRLELWSDPDRGRFTTRFSDGRGVLRHAVWQPDRDQQYVYDSSRNTTVVRVSRQQAKERWDQILFRDGLSLEDLEAGLLMWLENRQWRPVSFASGLALLASADGAALTMEEIPSAGGQPVVRLRARKTAGPVAVEFILEVNKRTYTPHLQSVRYECPARSLELQLYSEPAAADMAVSFEPPTPLFRSSSPAGIPAPAPVPAAAPEPDPLALELQIHQALHGVHACLGETIEVEPGPGGSFEVRGAVVSAERKDQVLAALAPLNGPRLAVNVKSAQEMLREIGPGDVTVQQQPAPPQVSDRRDATKSLARFFGGNEREAEAFADRVLSAGEDMMKDAQALRRLAESFGGHGLESPQARRIVRGMSRDHLSSLEAKVEAVRQSLRPVLDISAAAPQSAANTGRWDTEHRRIFQLARNLNDRLRALFAGARAGQSPDHLLHDLDRAISSLQSAVHTAAGNFSE